MSPWGCVPVFVSSTDTTKSSPTVTTALSTDVVELHDPTCGCPGPQVRVGAVGPSRQAVPGSATGPPSGKGRGRSSKSRRREVRRRSLSRVDVTGDSPIAFTRGPSSPPAAAIAAVPPTSTIAQAAPSTESRFCRTRRAAFCTSAHGAYRRLPRKLVQRMTRAIRDPVVVGDRGVVRSHRGFPGNGRATYAPRGGGTSRRLRSASSRRRPRRPRDRRSSRARGRAVAAAGATRPVR